MERDLSKTRDGSEFQNRCLNPTIQVLKKLREGNVISERERVVIPVTTVGVMKLSIKYGPGPPSSCVCSCFMLQVGGGWWPSSGK